MHAAGEDDWIHGELVGPEMGVEEMDGKDESRRQECFIAVEGGRHVGERGGEDQAVGKQLGKLKQQPAGSNDGGSPEYG